MLHTLQTCRCFTSSSRTARKSPARCSTRQDGVETVTESTNPEVTRLLQTHVASMLARVKEGRPIHQRDPLFAELFKNADRIEARHELTAGGVPVVETSKDAYVVKLLQAHAEVVSAFLANGIRR